MRAALRYSLVAVLIALPLSGARAQTCGTSTNQIRTFDVTPTAITLNATVADFSVGSVMSSYTVAATMKGNGKVWTVCAQPSNATMGTVSGYTKPLSDLQWSLDQSTWNSFVAGLTPITSVAGTGSFTLYVRALLDFGLDVPGSYGPVVVTFSVSN